MTPTPPRRHRLRHLALALGGMAVLAAPAHAASSSVLVRIDPDASRIERSALGEILDAEGVRSLPGGWREYRVPDPVSLAEARRDLAGADAADDVRVPQRVRLLDGPDDPYLVGGQQWGLRNTGGTGGTPGIDIRADGGWARATTRAPVVVAVVDTGVQTTHPDLAGRIWTNADEVPGNGIDDDANGYADDTGGWDFAGGDGTVYDDATGDRHGTHVAGIVAARQGDGTGIAGVAPNAVVMPLKFIGAGGTGWNSDAVRAIQYAVNNGATVINGSFGGGTEDPVLCDAIAWAAARGVVFVAAAGNTGQDLGVSGTWPARCAEPSMVVVSSISSTGALSGFSAWSPVHADLAAPGQTVLSTVPNGYAYMSGTSMAAPHVSGLLAAIAGEQPGVSPAALRSLVMETARPLPSLAGKTVTGGMADMDAALALAAGGDHVAPAAFAAAAPAAGTVTAARRPLFSWSASADAGLAGYRLLVDGVEVARTARATEAIPAGDIADGAHLWAVEAFDAAGNTRRTAEVHLTVDGAAPTAPALLVPAAGARVARTFTVVWTPGEDAVTGVARHEVLVDGAVAASVAGGGASARITVPAGRHRIAVRAVDGAGNSATSSLRTVSVRASATTARPAPRVSVAPRPARAGRATVVRVRASRAARVTIVAGTSAGRRVGRITRVVPRGASLVVLPRSIAVRIGTGGRVGLATVAAAR